MNNNEKEYDTLVLSGGGIKGFYLLGAIQALMDFKKILKINTFIGTSIGSIICYLLIIGYTPIEIVVSLYQNKWLEKLSHFNIVTLTDGFGAVSFTMINEALENLTISKIGKLLTLQQLQDMFHKKLICVTYNMTICTTEYISCETYPEMPCLIALRMSSNIPIIFEKFQYMDCFYVDGGISENFPIIKGEEIGSNVLGLLLDSNEKDFKYESKDGIVNYLTKLLQIPMTQLLKNQLSRVSSKSTIIKIQTNLSKNPIDFNVDSKLKLEMFSEGYTSVKFFFNFS